MMILGIVQNQPARPVGRSSRRIHDKIDKDAVLAAVTVMKQTWWGLFSLGSGGWMDGCRSAGGEVSFGQPPSTSAVREKPGRLLLAWPAAGSKCSCSSGRHGPLPTASEALMQKLPISPSPLAFESVNSLAFQATVLLLPL